MTTRPSEHKQFIFCRAVSCAQSRTDNSNI